MKGRALRIESVNISLAPEDKLANRYHNNIRLRADADADGKWTLEIDPRTLRHDIKLDTASLEKVLGELTLLTGFAEDVKAVLEKHGGVSKTVYTDDED